jgi:TonB family protein
MAGFVTVHRLLVGWLLSGEARADEPRLPVLIDYIPAAYPERALERAIEGDVLLSLTVDEEGFVVEVQVLQEAGHGFDGPAAEAARTMRFEPALDDKG